MQMIVSLVHNFLLSSLGPSWPEVHECYEIPGQTGPEGIKVFRPGKQAEKVPEYRAFSPGKS